ncbi:MAG: hypothetical protein EBT48_05935, partial [Verrucomicrobia bacterium]|nr:hypothetical protein [Verrucomicrobiota bacterium]
MSNPVRLSCGSKSDIPPFSPGPAPQPSPPSRGDRPQRSSSLIPNPLPRPLLRQLHNIRIHHNLRHLHHASESLGGTLLGLHNIHFLQDLMKQAHDHIAAG